MTSVHRRLWLERMTQTRPEEATGALAAALESGAAQLGFPLCQSQVSALLAFAEALRRWNDVHNLSAVQDPGSALTKHLLDSLAVVRPLERFLGQRAARVLDVGTGAGLPATVLAVARPDWRVVAVDSAGKKIAFVRQVAGELGLPNLGAVHGRVEAMKGEAPFDVILSRAFSTLREFVGLTKSLLAEGGAWVAMKGRRPDLEISEVGADVEVFHVEPVEVPGLGAERNLVWMRRVSMA